MSIFDTHYSATNKPSDLVLNANKKSKATRREDSTIFRDVQTLLTGSRSLLKSYNDLDEDLKSHRLDLPTSTWEKDEQDVKELLACGVEHAEKIAFKDLEPNESRLPQRNEPTTRPHEEAAGRLFEKSLQALDGECWGVVVSKHLQQFKNMVDTALPNDTRG